MCSKFDGARWALRGDLEAWKRLGSTRLRYALGVVVDVLEGMGYPAVVTRYQGGLPLSGPHRALRALDFRSHHVRPGDIPRVLEAVNEALPSPDQRYPTLIWEAPNKESLARVASVWQGPPVPLILSNRATAEHFHLQVPGGLLTGTVWDLSWMPAPRGVS